MKNKDQIGKICELLHKISSNNPRYELADNGKKQHSKIFICKELATKLVEGCRTTVAEKFRTRLGFKQNDVIYNQKQSMLTKIKESFEGEIMQT